MVANLLDSLISRISIMKDVSIRSHPFVGPSFLTVSRHEESDGYFETITEPQLEPPIRSDRPTELIIDDSPKMGLRSGRAVRSFGRGKGAQKVTALAARVHGNEKTRESYASYMPSYSHSMTACSNRCLLSTRGI